MKHLEVCQKYSTVCHIFYSLRGVSSGDETLRPMLDILHQGTNPSYLYTNYTFPGKIDNFHKCLNRQNADNQTSGQMTNWPL